MVGYYACSAKILAYMPYLIIKVLMMSTSLVLNNWGLVYDDYQNYTEYLETSPLEDLVYSVDFLPFFTKEKGDPVCFHTKSFLKMGLLKKGRICSKLFLFWVDPFQKGEKGFESCLPWKYIHHLMAWMS